MNAFHVFLFQAISFKVDFGNTFAQTFSVEQCVFIYVNRGVHLVEGGEGCSNTVGDGGGRGVGDPPFRASAGLGRWPGRSPHAAVEGSKSNPPLSRKRTINGTTHASQQASRQQASPAYRPLAVYGISPKSGSINGGALYAMNINKIKTL